MAWESKASKMTPEQKRAQRELCGFGEMYHTALRKGADTKWSVILWNMIVLFETIDADAAKKDRVWPHFVKWCEPRWHETGEKISEVVAAYLKAADEDHAREFPRTSASSMFHASLELCDKETWDEIDYTIEYCAYET